MAEGVTTEAVPIVGLLHTVPVLAATFDGLIRDAGVDVRPIHVVDGWLLDTVRREGVTREVHDAVASHSRRLGSMGARAVLVTCSSIGELAEAAAQEVAVPVLRVDSAMADEAVRIASKVDGRIAVLATLASTLRPTTALVQRAGAGQTIEVSAELVEGAAEAHDRGDRERVAELVAAAVVGAAERADVIVLAQASMAAAADRVEVPVPVLSSPGFAVRSLVRKIFSSDGPAGTVGRPGR